MSGPYQNMQVVAHNFGPQSIPDLANILHPADSPITESLHKLQTGGGSKVRYPGNRNPGDAVLVNLLGSGRNTSHMGLEVSASKPVTIGKKTDVRI